MFQMNSFISKIFFFIKLYSTIFLKFQEVEELIKNYMKRKKK